MPAIAQAGTDIESMARRINYGVPSIGKVKILENVTRSRDKRAALAFTKKALKYHGSPDAITADVPRSAMTGLSNREKQVGRWANNRVKTAIFLFDDESGQCCDFARCRRCRNSLLLMPMFTTLRLGTPSR